MTFLESEEDEQRTNEEVAKVKGAIALLAGTVGEYEFWSAFYAYAGEHGHRVMTVRRFNTLAQLEAEATLASQKRDKEELDRLRSAMQKLPNAQRYPTK